MRTEYIQAILWSLWLNLATWIVGLSQPRAARLMTTRHIIDCSFRHWPLGIVHIVEASLHIHPSYHPS